MAESKEQEIVKGRFGSPVRIDLPPSGTDLLEIRINGSIPDKPVIRSIMVFRSMTNEQFQLDSDDDKSENGSLKIINSSRWKFQIKKPQQFVATPGRWNYDMFFYKSGETEPLVLVYGSIII